MIGIPQLYGIIQGSFCTLKLPVLCLFSSVFILTPVKHWYSYCLLSFACNIVPCHVIRILQHVHAKSLQSCPTLCDPMDCSLVGYRPQACKELDMTDKHTLLCMRAKLLQSCLTICDPTDCNSPSSSVHGILQARILEWGAISFSRPSSWPRDWTCVSYISCISRKKRHRVV